MILEKYFNLDQITILISNLTLRDVVRGFNPVYPKPTNCRDTDFHCKQIKLFHDPSLSHTH